MQCLHRFPAYLWNQKMNSLSVADIAGPWKEPDFDSGLIDRCRRYWSVPVNELPDLIVATYLNQRMALPIMIAEAQQRITAAKSDESEMFEGQLREALNQATRSTP